MRYFAAHLRYRRIVKHIEARRIGEKHAAHAKTCTEPTCGLRPQGGAS